MTSTQRFPASSRISSTAAPSYQTLPIYAHNNPQAGANQLLGREQIGCSGAD